MSVCGANVLRCQKDTSKSVLRRFADGLNVHPVNHAENMI